MEPFAIRATSLGVEGIIQEYNNHIAKYEPPNVQYYRGNENLNRYRDVGCLEATRVILKHNVPPDTDYINANWVEVEGVDKPFIATQGPLEHTAGDFWRMIFEAGEEKTPTILMLCKVVEDKIQKCFQYWPLRQGEFKTYGCMMVSNKKTDEIDNVITYTLEVLPDGCSNSVFTTLYHFKDWPDRGLPASPMRLLRLLRTMRNNKLEDGPCIVHCSAGLGRTGTVIALEAALQQLMNGQTPNVREIVIKIRNQRPNLVKTCGQYVFIYAALLYYINAKSNRFSEGVLRFHDALVNSGLI